MMESIVLFVKANVMKLWITLIPASFFLYTKDEILVIQLFFITLGLDVILGITLAIKMRRFSSHQMGRVIPKFMAYCVAIIMITIINDEL